MSALEAPSLQIAAPRPFIFPSPVGLEVKSFWQGRFASTKTMAFQALRA